MLLFLVFLISSTLCIGFPIFKTFLEKESSHDLLFLVLSNSLFLISTALFTFYFKELGLGLCSSFFLLGYSVFLILHLKKENKVFSLLEIPYFLFTSLLFLYLFIQFFF